MPSLSLSRYRWFVVFLIAVISMLDYIDRSAISYAMPIIGNIYHLSTEQKGYIFGIFGVGYVASAFLGGIFADRFGARITLGISAIAWGLSLIGCGLSTGFFGFIIARFVLGLSEGPNFPCLTRATGDWLLEKERVRALSWSLVAVPTALAIGGLIATQLIIHFKWRWMFIILGVLSLIWVPFWVIFFRNKPEQSRFTHYEALPLGEAQTVIQSKEKTPWKVILWNPTLLSTYWAFFVFGYMLFFFMSWMPSYLVKMYHLDLKSQGLFTFLPWSCAAVFMLVLGSWSDAIRRKGGSLRTARSWFIVVTLFLAALSLMPMLWYPGLMTSLIALSLGVGIFMSANGAYYAIHLDCVPKWAGTSLGVMCVWFAFSGIVSPVITSWLISQTGHYRSAFGILIVLCLSAIPTTLIFNRPDKKITS
jgi:ACS family hexuronate transporter-like MFS transporter